MSGLFQDDPSQDDPNLSGAADDAPPLPDGPGLFGDALPEHRPEPIQAAPYRVLARKYRPTTFDDLIGQEAMVRILRNAFAIGRVAHAFMLTGVRGVGKTTTARIVARALNCVGPDGAGGPTADPCGVCGNCVAILADRHPDVIEMDAASRTGVDDVREIIEATRFRPMQARTKVFIVDEVHMLSRNAFNALLKTLEEPPPHVKFVFATTELRKVPVTVLSRCQRFDLRRVRMAELSAHFAGIAAKEGAEIDPGALELIARAADGSVRDGLSLLDQAIAQAEGPIARAQVADMLGQGDRDAVFDLLEAVLAGKPAAALAIADRSHERGADPGTLLHDLLELLHVLTRLKTVPGLRDSADLPEAERTRGAELADRATIPTLARAWQMLLKGVGEIEAAPDRRAAADMILIRLCHAGDMPTPGDLVRRILAEGGGIGAAAGGAAPISGSAGSGPGGGGSTGGGYGGARAVAGGQAVAAAPVIGAAPRLASFRDVVALAAERREAMTHAHLVNSVHVVSFAPGRIEWRQSPDAPANLAREVSTLLSRETGTPWLVSVATQGGGATLAEQGAAADQARRDEALDHPLVRAILDAFPGARMADVRDANADAYGLTPEPPPEMPDFAPPDAAFLDDDDPSPWETDA